MDNLLLDKIKYLNSLIHLTTKSCNVVNNNLQVELLDEQLGEAKNKLNEWSIKYENFVDNELYINLTSVDENTTIFFEEINFRQGVERLVNASSGITKNIALLVYCESYFFYEFAGEQSYINSKLDSLNFLVENAVYYFKILSVLKSSGFADYVNTIEKEIVLYSSEKGIKRIKVPDYIPDFDVRKSIKRNCETLTSRLESPDFKIYFKNQLFNFRTTDASNALKEIIISLESIIPESENSLQLYLKKFSFEKLKNDLQKEKEKYFSSLREILGKNLSQIVAIPISFAASVFATYKVTDFFILVIILIAYVLYSVFTYYLQTLYLNDVKEIEESFKADFKTISEKSGLLSTEIDLEKKKIDRRISDIRNVIARFRYLLIALTVIFLIFIVYQIIQMYAKATLCNLIANFFSSCKCK